MLKRFLLINSVGTLVTTVHAADLTDAALITLENYTGMTLSMHPNDLPKNSLKMTEKSVDIPEKTE